MRPTATVIVFSLGFLLVSARADDLPPPAPGAVDFARDVQPILEKSCIRCHGPKKKEGGLALDGRDATLKGGESGPALVAGKSAESRLIRFVSGTDPAGTVMPPEGAGKLLSAEQVGILRAWVDQGAKWSEKTPAAAAAAAATVAKPAGPTDHWAFKKPVRPPLPEVHDAAWPRNPIDRFVLARLEKEGLKPSPEADRATLIRRLSLDLTGLPPTVEEVDAFDKDARPDAYERLVDRLLDSPHFGERWARFWLDRARYADTNGYEKDRDRSIWPYRDWVIRALNADMPFDRFTVEQIAGDLLPHATLDQKVATGFHRNTMTNEEGGIDIEEFRFASLVDRVGTTGTVWLGLTVQCAQCHAHKYDPITQREYYQLMALLNNADEPEIDVPTADLMTRRGKARAEIATLEASRAGKFPGGPSALDAQQAAWEKSQHPVNWSVVRPTTLTSKKHATMEVQPDGSVLVTGDKPNNDVYTVELPTGANVGTLPITALRLEVLPDPSLPDNGPGRAPLFSVGDFLLTELTVDAAVIPPRPVDRSRKPELPIVGGHGGDTRGFVPDLRIATRSVPSGPEKLVRLTLTDASEDFAEPGHPASKAIDGITDTGWSIRGGVGKAHTAVFTIKDDLFAGGSSWGPSRLVVTMHQEYIHQMTIGRFRLSVTSDPKPVKASGLPADVEAALLVPRAKRMPLQAACVRDCFLSVAPELAGLNKEIEAQRQALPKYPTTMVMQERRPEHARVTKVHKRGEFLKEADPVEPGVPAVLHPLPTGAPRNRLGLARWLVSPDNPLVGRVVVNQVWQVFFGRGLVTTPEDFGAKGARPTHPELLDWLAVEFPTRGWSLKTLHRLIVTSATYRQSSRVTPEGLAKDPKNELLARGPRFRVEAETVRDMALAASGLLNGKVGGPSVYPPQPEGVTALAYGGPSWPTSTGLDRYRRGLYTFWKRTAPYATSMVFDSPSSDTVCVRRERSNTPLQALTVLNDPVFLDASRALARRVLAKHPETGSTDDRATYAFRLVLSRRPRPDEVQKLAAFHDRQRDRFQKGELDAAQVAGLDPKAKAPAAEPAELAAWTTVARALLNLDEAVTKE